MDLTKLGDVFSPEDVEWRIQRSGMSKGRPWALVLAYITNRAIMERLDEVCGAENWCNRFKEAPSGGVLCGISIRIVRDEKAEPWEEWVTKWDGAENTEIESIKGGLSSAMKRAGVQWGIGRYLYNLDTGWANIFDGGKHKDKIKTAEGDTYFKWNPPDLPDWALPEAHQGKVKETAEDDVPEPKTTRELNKDATIDALKSMISVKMGSMPDEEKKEFFVFTLSDRKITTQLLNKFYDDYDKYKKAWEEFKEREKVNE